MERKRYRVKGRVQGVGFRAWLMDGAQELELNGWACNHADGSVELEVAGEAAAVARFRQKLAEGPRLARVDEVAELAAGTNPLPYGFAIVRAPRT